MCVAEQTNSGLHPRVRGYKGLANQLHVCCCGHTCTCCCRICQLRTAPIIQGLQGFRRPSGDASIHICIAEIRVAPRDRSFTRASPTNCCCEHTHARCRLNHLRVAPKVTRVRPTNCGCNHTHVFCIINQIRAAPKGRNVSRVRPTRCCCKHTRVCCRMIKLWAHARINAGGGLADQILLGAYTCVWQNTRIQGCSQASKVTKVWPTDCCSEHTRVCCRM